MGNHEYCELCGASSFHYGQPCQPERLAAYEARQREIKARDVRLSGLARKICAKLVAEGLPARIDDYGHVLIRKWDLD